MTTCVSGFQKHTRLRCGVRAYTVSISRGKHSKSKVVIFSRAKIRKLPQVKFGNNKLEVCDDNMYLGLKFNYNVKFIKTLLMDRGNRALFGVLRKSRQQIITTANRYTASTI